MNCSKALSATVTSLTERDAILFLHRVMFECIQYNRCPGPIRLFSALAFKAKPESEARTRTIEFIAAQSPKASPQRGCWPTSSLAGPTRARVNGAPAGAGVHLPGLRERLQPSARRGQVRLGNLSGLPIREAGERLTPRQAIQLPSCRPHRS